MDTDTRTGGAGGSASKKAVRRGAAGKLGLGLLLNTGMDLLSEKGPGFIEGAKKVAVNSASWVGEKRSKIIEAGKNWAGENGPKLLDKGKSFLGESGSKMMDMGKSLISGGGLASLAKNGNLLGKGIKLIGKNLPGPLGLVGDAAAIATADSKKDRVKATTSAVLSAAGGVIGGVIGSVVPGAGTAIGATLGSIGGDFLGNKVGGFLYDKFFSKKDKAESQNKNTAMSSTAASVSKGTSNISKFPQAVPFPATNVGSVQGGYRNRQGEGEQKQNSKPYQINVSLSQGALNLTVNKDEINYDELAKAAGQKIANEVRFAMQNLK